MVLRFRVSSQSLAKAASVASNSVMLATNVYLAGSGLREQALQRRRERVASTLHSAAEVAQTLSGLVNVVTATLQNHHAQGS